MPTPETDRRFEVPQGSFDIQRYPGPEINLLGWDGADELLLAWVAEHGAELTGATCVVNDRFGALAIALAERSPQSWGDSCLAERGLQANVERNGKAASGITFVPSSELPAGPIGVLLIKVPKSLAELEEQLAAIRPLLSDDATVVAAGMTKTIHLSTLDLFEKYLGVTTTSLAKKKARLIFPIIDPATTLVVAPEPATYDTPEGHTVISYGPVFSRESLDIGTRLLLEALPAFVGTEHVIDLGAGSGVVGLSVLARSAETTVLFTDESYLAIASARATVEANVVDASRASYLVDDCGENVPSGSADVVLINPPFHDRAAKSNETAKRMIGEAKRILKPGGSVYVVGNRHLGYHNHLKRRFGHSETVKSNAKFSVLRATKR